MHIGGYMTEPDGAKYVVVDDKLTCLATGFPTIIYEWKWNDGVMSHLASGADLTVTQPGFRNYTCVATNTVGSDSVSIELIVAGESQSHGGGGRSCTWMP